MASNTETSTAFCSSESTADQSSAIAEETNLRTLCTKTEYKKPGSDKLRSDTTQLAEAILEWSVSPGQDSRLPASTGSPTAIIMSNLILRVKHRLPEFEQDICASNCIQHMKEIASLLLDDFSGEPKTNKRSSASCTLHQRDCWGNIVMLFSIASKLASQNHHQVVSKPESRSRSNDTVDPQRPLQNLAKMLSAQLLHRSNVANWMRDQNGWEGFNTVFKSNQSFLPPQAADNAAVTTEFHTIIAANKNQLETVDFKALRTVRQQKGGDGDNDGNSSAAESNGDYCSSSDDTATTPDYHSYNTHHHNHPSDPEQDNINPTATKCSTYDEVTDDETTCCDEMLSKVEMACDWKSYWLAADAVETKSDSTTIGADSSDSENEDDGQPTACVTGEAGTETMSMTITGYNEHPEDAECEDSDHAEERSVRVIYGVLDSADMMNLDRILSLAIPLSALGIMAYHALKDSQLSLGSTAVGSALITLADRVGNTVRKVF